MITYKMRELAAAVDLGRRIASEISAGYPVDAAIAIAQCGESRVRWDGTIQAWEVY